MKQVEPVSEQSTIQDKIDLMFSGTTVTMGKARAVVINTGAKTEIGKVCLAFS